MASSSPSPSLAWPSRRSWRSSIWAASRSPMTWQEKWRTAPDSSWLLFCATPAVETKETLWKNEQSETELDLSSCDLLNRGSFMLEYIQQNMVIFRPRPVINGGRIQEQIYVIRYTVVIPIWPTIMESLHRMGRWLLCRNNRLNPLGLAPAGHKPCCFLFHWHTHTMDWTLWKWDPVSTSLQACPGTSPRVHLAYQGNLWYWHHPLPQFRVCWVRECSHGLRTFSMATSMFWKLSPWGFNTGHKPLYGQIGNYSDDLNIGDCSRPRT